MLMVRLADSTHRGANQRRPPTPVSFQKAASPCREERQTIAQTMLTPCPAAFGTSAKRNPGDNEWINPAPRATLLGVYRNRSQQPDHRPLETRTQDMAQTSIPAHGSDSGVGFRSHGTPHSRKERANPLIF